MKALVKIIAPIPCAVCGEMMSQKDIDNQEAIVSGNNPVIMNVIAHLKHFYYKVGNRYKPTKDFKLNQAKFAYAIGEKSGWNNDPAKRQYALNQIANLEKKYGQK